MGLLVIFILSFLFYRNYIILSEDEFVIIVGNLIWLVLANSLIVNNIYKILDDRGLVIKNIFCWYLNKKKSLYIKLILIYSYVYSYSKSLVENKIGYINNFIIMFLYSSLESKKVYLNYYINNIVIMKYLYLKIHLNILFLKEEMQKYMNKGEVIELFINKLSNK